MSRLPKKGIIETFTDYCCGWRELNKGYNSHKDLNDFLDELQQYILKTEEKNSRGIYFSNRGFVKLIEANIFGCEKSERLDEKNASTFCPGIYSTDSPIKLCELVQKQIWNGDFIEPVFVQTSNHCRLPEYQYYIKAKYHNLSEMLMTIIVPYSLPIKQDAPTEKFRKDLSFNECL